MYLAAPLIDLGFADLSTPPSSTPPMDLGFQICPAPLSSTPPLDLGFADLGTQPLPRLVSHSVPVGIFWAFLG